MLISRAVEDVCCSHRVRFLRVSVAAVAVAAGLVLLLSASAAQAAACPNGQYRAGASARLPDCRAYEQVSPIDKNDGEVGVLNELVATSGNAITYPSNTAFAGASAAAQIDQYLSKRSSSGWTTQGVTPAYLSAGVIASPQYSGYSSDLSRMVLHFYAPPKPAALYLRDVDGTFKPIGISTTSAPGNISFAGASADFANVLFAATDDLTTDSQGLPTSGSDWKLYEGRDGQVRLVSVLPSGAASLGNTPQAANMISADGSRIYWQSNGRSGASAPIYLSETGAVSKLVSADQSGTAQPGTLLAATSSGSEAFFLSAAQLTSDASPVGTDLYRYDADAASGKLVDLTPDAVDASGAAAQGLVAVSDDGSYVYFVAKGVLTSVPNARGVTATGGQPNLYLSHGGTTTFIATLASADIHDWVPSWGPWNRSTVAQLTADGRHLVFTSAARLETNYDNADNGEIYLYDASSGGLSCVSCNQYSAATADVALSRSTTIYFGFSGLVSNELAPVNNLSPDASRIFFETTDALLPADTNGQEDVYEWEADGAGSCTSSGYNGGCLHLLSDGRGGSPSLFEGASRSGDDAFILTRSKLVGQDTDGLLDVYDARVGGGLASQHPALPPAPCSGDSCRGALASAPAWPKAGSIAFAGPGNIKPSGSSGGRVAVFRVHALSRRQRRRLAGGHRIGLRVRVSEAGAVKARVRGRLGRHHRVRTLAYGRRRARRGGIVKVHLRMAKRPRRYLRRHGGLRVAIQVRYSKVHGVQRARLALERPARHQRGGRR